jgi:hypothetical protein
MKLSWKQIKLFGFTVTLPSIIIIVETLNPIQVEQFRKYRSEMAECPKCHKLFGGRAGLSFMMHLKDEHRLTSEDSMDIVAKLYKNLLHRTAERRSAAQVS